MLVQSIVAHGVTRLVEIAAAHPKGAMIITEDLSDHESTSILIVCTANVCRSPLVQHTLCSAFDDSSWLGDIDVVSAGTQAQPNLAICEISASRLGDDDDATAFAASHRSRPLTHQEAVSAGLILTAEREHRGAVARLAPGSQAKIFTWKEATALAEAAEQRILAGHALRPKNLPSLATLLHSMRGSIPLTVPYAKRRSFLRPSRRVEHADPISIPDGHGQPLPEHTHTAAETKDAAERLGVALSSVT